MNLVSQWYMYVSLCIANYPHYASDSDSGIGTGVTAAGLGATLVLVIAIVFTVTVIKLQKDKANMKKLIKSLTVQSSSGIAVKGKEIMKTLKSVSRKYPQKLWTLKSTRILHTLLLNCSFNYYKYKKQLNKIEE